MDLHGTVSRLMADGKGILCADEDTAVLQKRFSAAGIAHGEDAVRDFHRIIFSSAGIERFLSGVSLSPSALKESMEDGTLMPGYIADKELLVGVSSDENPLESFIEEMKEYRSFGVSFGKRTMHLSVGDDLKTERAKEFADLARFAEMSQALDIVPVLGVHLSENGAYTDEEAEALLGEAYLLLFDTLGKTGVDMKGVVLETTFPRAGSKNPTQSSETETAEHLFRALTSSSASSVPQEVGGILLYSEGESPEQATAELNALSRLEPFPWPIAFSFSSALTDPVLAAWQGKEENIPAAQAALDERLSLNVLGDRGGYAKSMET